LAQTEELIKSVHMFSKKPVLVYVFGENPIPASWTAEKYPQLVVFTSGNIVQHPKIFRWNFNYNKMRAMLMAKVRTGIQLDSDQFIVAHTDYLFQRTKEEVTDAYPYPIMPVHWMTKDDTMGQKHAYEVYDFHCPDCPTRTMRWGQAHPTWSSAALPFLGKWLEKAFSQQDIFGQRFLEDEDLFNIALWDAGVKKQWCKFDLAPGDVEHMYPSDLSAPRPMMVPQFEDPKWYPEGVTQVFFTCHGAKDVAKTKRQLEGFSKMEDRESRPWVAHKRKSFSSVADFHKAHSEVSCLL